MPPKVRDIPNRPGSLKHFYKCRRCGRVYYRYSADVFAGDPGVKKCHYCGAYDIDFVGTNR